jgi:RNA polymerase sigma-70 factor (ECF subfamily)
VSVAIEITSVRRPTAPLAPRQGGPSSSVPPFAWPDNKCPERSRPANPQPRAETVVILKAPESDLQGMREVRPIDTVSPSEGAVRHAPGDFDDFYIAEMPRLIALARGLSAAASAEDLAQEAMLVAYRRWHVVRDADRPDLWVRRTCANLAVSHLRRRIVEVRALNRLGSRRPRAVELSESTDEFWTAVRLLPPRQAQAAALRFIYDMPIADIAETMDCSEGTVKQHLMRAKLRLAAALGVTAEVES